MTKEQELEKIHHKTLEESAKRLEELKDNRHVDDLSVNDSYWIALSVHRLLYNK